MQIPNTTNEIPIACTLTADEQKARGDGIVRSVVTGYEEVRELPDGYALRFPGSDDWASTLFQFIAEERVCCAFFTFALVFEPGQGAIWLHLGGSTAIKAFVKETFLAAHQP